MLSIACVSIPLIALAQSAADPSAQIQALLDQVKALQQQLVELQTSASPLTATFTIGDRVRTTANLNVRATPSLSGRLLGTQQTGAFATIFGGPSISVGMGGIYTWWNINYDIGADGWSVQNYLTKVSAFPTLTATPTSGSAPLAVSFVAALPASTGLAAPNYNYTLAFGDGSTQTLACPAQSQSCTTTASHTYATAGTYTATLSNLNAPSATILASVTIVVTNVESALPTIAYFATSPSTIPSGQSSTLSWSVPGATSLSISGIGTVTGAMTECW